MSDIFVDTTLCLEIKFDNHSLLRKHNELRQHYFAWRHLESGWGPLNFPRSDFFMRILRPSQPQPTQPKKLLCSTLIGSTASVKFICRKLKSYDSGFSQAGSLRHLFSGHCFIAFVMLAIINSATFNTAIGQDDHGAGGSSSKPNALINESSPYLLMHAHNPVDWQPWNEATLAKAKAEGKPVFLSVGYSSCHWCHVMERESFLDQRDR